MGRQQEAPQFEFSTDEEAEFDEYGIDDDGGVQAELGDDDLEQELIDDESDLDDVVS